MASLTILFLALIFLSAFFSGSESALFSLKESELTRFKESRFQRFKKVARLMKDPEGVLIAILLGNLGINIAISLAGHRIVFEIFEGSRNIDLISLLFLTVTLVIFAETIPKVFAIRYSQSWSVRSTPLLNIWLWLSKPFAIPALALTRFWNTGEDSGKKNIKEKELIEAVESAQNRGLLGEDEEGMLKRAIRFYHDTAYNVMVPKSECLMIPDNLDYASTAQIFHEQKTPAAVVYDHKTDKVVGYIHVRSLIPLRLSKKPGKKISIKPAIQEILFLPKTLSLDVILEEFLKRQVEVAAVVDEMGEFSGILRMKEIFQSLMGDLDEEFRQNIAAAVEDVVKVKKDTFIVEGSMTLNKFNEHFESDLNSETSETISGFLIEKLDGYPRSDTILEIQNMKFFSMELYKNRIAKARLIVRPKKEG